jgi:hypothetical protein
LVLPPPPDQLLFAYNEEEWEKPLITIRNTYREVGGVGFISDVLVASG